MIDMTKGLDCPAAGVVATEGWELVRDFHPEEDRVYIESLKTKYGQDNVKKEDAYDCDGAIMGGLNALYVKPEVIGK